MANHKSAKKRNRQTLKRNKVNRSLRSKINNNINRFNSIILSKNMDQIMESFSSVNSSLAKAAKKGPIVSSDSWGKPISCVACNIASYCFG